MRPSFIKTPNPKATKQLSSCFAMIILDGSLGGIMETIQRLAIFTLAIGLLGAMAVPARAAAAPNFSIQELGTANVTFAQAFGINNKGDIAGLSDDATGGNFGAALWLHPGQTTFIDPDTGPRPSAANDINKQGVAVGYKYGEITGLHAYVWHDGLATHLPSLSSSLSTSNDYADEINDSGQIVGYSVDDGGVTHAVTWVNSTAITDLAPGPETETAGAFGINNQGVVTGSWNGQAVTWENGVMTILPIPRPVDIPADATVFSDGRSINDNGDVAGYIAWTSESAGVGGYRAFLWSDGVATILQPLDNDHVECIAYGINDRKEIVGHCGNGQTGETRAFYWKNGIMHDPGILPGYVSSSAQSINTKGEFVGFVTDEAGLGRAVRWR